MCENERKRVHGHMYVRQHNGVESNNLRWASRGGHAFVIPLVERLYLSARLRRHYRAPNATVLIDGERHATERSTTVLLTTRVGASRNILRIICKNEHPCIRRPLPCYHRFITYTMTHMSLSNRSEYFVTFLCPYSKDTRIGCVFVCGRK